MLTDNPVFSLTLTMLTVILIDNQFSHAKYKGSFFKAVTGESVFTAKNVHSSRQ